MKQKELTCFNLDENEYHYYLYEDLMTMQASLEHAPAVQAALSDDKKRDIAHEFRWMAQQLGLQSQADYAVLSQQLQRYYGFMAQWLNPSAQHPFVTALAKLLPYEPSAANQMVQSILLNRRDDAYATARWLADPQALAQLLPVPSAPLEEIGPLPQAKQNELLQTMQMPRAGAMEPAAHIHMTAQGHREGHAALAQAFAPESEAGRILQQAVREELRDIPPDRVQMFAHHWMQVRSTRAAQVAQGYEASGPLVQQAVANSEQHRLRKGPVLASATQNMPDALPSDQSWKLSDVLRAIIAQGPRVLGLSSPDESGRNR